MEDKCAQPSREETEDLLDALSEPLVHQEEESLDHQDLEDQVQPLEEWALELSEDSEREEWAALPDKEETEDGLDVSTIEEELVESITDLESSEDSERVTEPASPEEEDIRPGLLALEDTTWRQEWSDHTSEVTEDALSTDVEIELSPDATERVTDHHSPTELSQPRMDPATVSIQSSRASSNKLLGVQNEKNCFLNDKNATK